MGRIEVRFPLCHWLLDVSLSKKLACVYSERQYVYFVRPLVSCRRLDAADQKTLSPTVQHKVVSGIRPIAIV